MKKINYYFKNLKIDINESHKQAVKSKIMDLYVPSKKRVNLNVIFAYAVSSAAVITVLFFTALGIGRSNFVKNEKYKKIYPDKKDAIVLKREESKNLTVEKDKTINNQKDYFSSDDKMKSEESIILEEHSKKDIDDAIIFEKEKEVYLDSSKELLSYNADYGNITEKEAADEKKSLRKDSYAEDQKSRKSEIKQETIDQDASIKKIQNSRINNVKDIDFIPTKQFNTLYIHPNFNTSSIEYINKQITNKLPIDVKNIKDEELINYLCADYQDLSLKDQIESIIIFDNYYLLLISIGSDLTDSISITFNNAVESYYLYGYNDKNKKEIMSGSEKKSNASVLLIYKLTDMSINDICRISFIQKDSNNAVKKSDYTLAFAQIKDIEKSSLTMRQAVLSYMILQNLKNNGYKKSDIISFKYEYIDKKNFKLKDEHNIFIEEILK